ncbi:hypothetical protein ACLS0F_10665 [Avibacterium endocarditidis]|uniref:DUF2956 domain-containing protein n=1 Tax=Avibacterium endocarditidis TaxID=380674 RepID=A0ABX4ZVY5_9PAST|nr:hypothetical protein [Avibacterium endocarditidis]POY43174.1 hypothetical protein C3Z13_00380 [Avibacterium endocarditidis]
MNNLTSKELDVFDPFASKPKSNIFNKLGHQLGGMFVSAKKAATNKYLDVTKGINQRIEEEQRLIDQEIFAHLAAQAEAFEQEARQKKKRWIFISLGLMMLSLLAGAFGAYFMLI